MSVDEGRLGVSSHITLCTLDHSHNTRLDQHLVHRACKLLIQCPPHLQYSVSVVLYLDPPSIEYKLHPHTPCIRIYTVFSINCTPHTTHTQTPRTHKHTQTQHTQTNTHTNKHTHTHTHTIHTDTPHTHDNM